MSKPTYKNFDGEAPKRLAPTMSRSRGQLAAAYAPGAFFTFEGGLGSCIAQPAYDTDTAPAPISATVRNQIVMRMEEAIKAWYAAASRARDNKGQNIPPIRGAQCLTEELLVTAGNAVRPIDPARFVFASPDKMGYAPAPLTFVCNHCGTYRYFGSVDEFYKTAPSRLKRKCDSHEGECHWRQLDVIFVHWSGNWEPVRPGTANWDPIAQEVKEPFDRCPQCHETEFRLETRHSETALSGWYFQCKNCGHADTKGWRKNDPVTMEIVRDDFAKYVAVARMEAVSYRASAAFYAQSDQFIIFDDKQEGLLALLDPSQTPGLKSFLAAHFGFGKGRPTMPEIEIILAQTDKGAASLKKWQKRQALLKAAADQDMIDALTEDIKDIEASWFDGDPPLVKETTNLPPPLVAAVDSRKTDFDGRYDPFRLVVEHEALKRNHLDATRAETGRSPFVPFDRLDPDLAPPDAAAKAAQEAATRVDLDRLGIATMGLIRNFKLCRFTYGYTRVDANPVTERHNTFMPVRLNLFPRVKSGDQGLKKNPIYVVTQENEAFYVRLNDEHVYAWLTQLGLSDAFPWTKTSGEPLGAKILEHAQPMQRFLKFVYRDQPPYAYYYTYTLLHTYSHLMMRAISELSGLDAGSLGEYIFPADLAFVVYRSGTTLDLGNLSSLWRNANRNFLTHLTEPTTLGCNSGSLCAARGGACPDCLLIPETSCIASNQLLSRSVLRGGPRPREDMGDSRIRGYLEIVQDALAANPGAAPNAAVAA